MQTKWSLTVAQKVKNDEFYTPLELTKEFVDPFKDQLIGKRIICPCDGEQSEIYKYLKSLNLNVDRSDRYETVDYSKYDIVITNPPFSKMKDFMCNYIKDKDYLLIGYWMMITYVWFVKKFLPKCMWKNLSAKFNNNDKAVNINFITTLKVPENWKHKKMVDIIDGKKYSQNVFSHTQRKDFCRFSQWKENGFRTFGSYIFGKTTEWIKQNIPHLEELRYNLFDGNMTRETFPNDWPKKEVADGNQENEPQQQTNNTVQN